MPPAPDAHERRRDRALAALVFGLLAALYVAGAPAQPAWGDGLSFLATSAEGFDLDTNATSHVLYLNLGVLLTRWLSAWPNAGVLVGLSLVSALGALLLTYRLNRLGASAVGALFGVVSLGLGFTFWRHAVTIEVYALNLVTVAAVLLLAARDLDAQTPRSAVRLGALWGLSLLVHIQNVLLAPLAAYYLWRTRPALGTVARGALAAAATASPLVILPLVFETHSLSAVLFDASPGNVLSLSLGGLARGVALSVGYALYNLHVWLVPVAVGAVRLWRGHREVALALALVAGVHWLFAARYAVSDAYVFYLTPYLCAAPCAAAGFDALLRSVSAPARRYAVVASVAVSPLLYAGVTEAVRASPLGARIEAAKGYKGGVRFYLYPGMRGTPDPLDLARRPAPPAADEWNVEAARLFLQLEAKP